MKENGRGSAGSPARRVTYADGTTSVLPGDRVSVRLFLRRREGEVMYVPGISKRRATYEHNGLTWVGVALADGWAIGEIVLPETGALKPTVRVLGRGAESEAAADAMRRVADQEAEEDAAVARDAASASVGRPRPVDWLAGAVAVGLKLGLYLLVVVAIAAVVLLGRRCA